MKEPAGLSTPIRRQYLDLKARQPDAILFFRLGDFYETFDDDAQLVSAELGIALTSKPMGKGLRVPLAGVPVQSIEGHLARLIAAGHRVAIAEQLEEARASKGLVRRGIVRVVSPGTALEPTLLESGRNAFCAALDVRPLGRAGGGSASGSASGRGRSSGGRKQGAIAALALADLSTGELRGCELQGEDIASARAAALTELERLGARELLLPAPDPHAADPHAAEPQVAPAAAAANGWTLTPRPAARFDPASGSALLCRRFGLSDVEGLGLAGRPALQAALGALLDYLAEGQGLGADTDAGADQESPAPAAAAQADRLAHLGRPQIYEPSAAMRLDAASVRALDLFPSQAGPARAGVGPGSGSGPATSPGSLLELLDRCRTAAGKRLLRRRLERPLIALEAIEQRQQRVALLRAQPLLRARLRERLGAVPDLQRLLGRAATGLAAPAELAALGRGLAAAAALSALLREQAQRPGPAPAPGSDTDALLDAMAAELPAAAAAQSAISQTLADEPESLAEGKGEDAGEVLRPGCDARVDALRLRLRAGRESLAALEARERQRSGVASLKLGYHRSFGYYLELGRSHAGAAPPDWERRQTLAGGERYVSPELRTLERELLEARDALVARERELYAALCRRVAGQAAAVQRLAAGVARLDVDAALAEVAAAGGWTRPQLDRSAALEIREGRHPLVEAGLPAGRFVPNDLALDGAGDQVLVVTGPNMAGKSTYLRQTALIVLLAQIGSFVPAARARLGLVDRVFARVGAQDQIAAGRSTFMVEMLETAAICSAATPRSLLVLDEIGRGTSTYDGLAIARALLEHLVRGREGPRTLFATHFHELTALAGEGERVANASVLVGETADGQSLRFLYRIVPGAADRSYGVQVAAMAGLPASLLARAREILAALESRPGGPGGANAGSLDGSRLASFGAAAGTLAELRDSPLLRELAALDVDGLTPLEAIGALYALRERARGLQPGPPGPQPRTGGTAQVADQPPPYLLQERPHLPERGRLPPQPDEIPLEPAR